jgi:putative membrane protein
LKTSEVLRNPVVLLVALSVVVSAWSAYKPWGYDVWLFEISAGIIGVAALAATYRWFRFSNLVYILVGIHFVVLAVAAKYTYGEMPLFNWLRDALGMARNHYDRVGHFMQGFVPAMVAREILLRKTPLEKGKMLGFICISICLAISAFWELLEWWVVVMFYPEKGQEWLGLQGDVWDPHWDMFMALVGAAAAVLVLSGLHNRSMAAVGEAEATPDAGRT